MKSTLTLTTLALAAALSACTSLAPDYQRPAGAVPARLPVPAETAVAAPASPMAWTEFVREPRLRQLVQQALEHNRDLRVAALNVQRAQAQLGVTRADRWPTVGAGLSGSRAPNSSGVQTTTLQAGLQVSAWEMDFFGRIASLTDAAQAQLLATEAGRRSAELSLVASVLAADRTLAADEALLALAERTVASRAESLKLTRLRDHHGAASQLELQSAQSLSSQAEATLIQARRQVAQDRNALALLLGAPVPTELLPAAATVVVPGADAAATPEVLAIVPAGLDSSVLLRRPDVQQAEQQLIAANANIGAARAAFFPRITLTASAGLASNQLSSLLEAGSFAWTIAPQALLTVFDYGRNRNNLEATRLSRDIAVAQYEKSVQSAFRDTADALAGLATWRDQLSAQQRQVDATRDIQRLTELRYSNGAASELERLDAQRSLFGAEQLLIQTALAEQQNRIALFKALGG
ncbi:multidrug efflux system outer membrane protein [Sphaerotilus hippei]|uniref:Multidrug efflux system outer membrane protein n=1 Tax=Sphaerotilus hippei TaxID=744406 RepID=A0A318GXK0_9BURK|nr:efflux transporter outer membrane subunit [Sphaerotilus hippei]PXW94532.1 multidrug efflux system outer membrane protein [Sphaerotilus hippei]